MKPPSKPPSKPGRAAGFLLLELLVALALTGIVTLLLVGGVRLASLGLDRVTYQADRVEQRRNVAELLRRALESASVLPVVANRASFVGTAANVSFVTLVEDRGPGLYRIDLGVAARGGQRALVLSRSLLSSPGAERTERSVLAWPLRDFSIAYYGATAPNQEAAWHTEWQAINYPPSLVRITIDTGDRRPNPPIVVRLWSGAG